MKLLSILGEKEKGKGERMQQNFYRLISTPKRAIRYYQKVRWKDGITCIHCGVIGENYRHSERNNGIRRYHCTACKKYFSDTTGTIFHKSKVPLWKWLLAIYEMSQPTSVSAMELKRKLQISYPAALNMHRKIRRLLAQQYSRDSDKPLGGEVEADEAWFGKKLEQEIMFGVVERKGDVRLMPLFGLKEEDLQEGLEEYVKKGSQLFTDRRVGYSNLKYSHKTVNHSKEFKDKKTGAHINTMEHLWGTWKGIIRTVHHGVTKAWRWSYLYSFATKWNYRWLPNLFEFIVHLTTKPYLLSTRPLQ